MSSIRQDIIDQARPTPGKPLIEYPSPIPQDLIVAVNVNLPTSQFDPLHPLSGKEDNDTTGLDLRLCYQSPIKGTDEQISVTRIYANERVRQDYYNYNITYDLESITHPQYIRSYLVRRDKYAPLAKGSKLTGVLMVRVTNAGSNYVTPVASVSGGSGSGCELICITTKGSIDAVIVVQEGTGYTSIPTVTITDSGGSGSGATATAFIQPTNCALTKESVSQVEDNRLSSIYLSVVRVFEVIPGPIRNVKGINSVALGAISTTTIQRVAAGTAPEPNGFLTLESIVSDIDTVTAEKRVTTVESYPTLVGSEFDDRTGNLITISKTFVPAGTTGSVSDGTIVEVQPYDSEKSIAITSQINLTVSSRNTPIKYNFRFPNTLQKSKYVGAYAITEDSQAWDIGLNLDIINGYSGPCDGTLHEVYTYNPEGVSIPSITKFFPQGHMISFAWAYANEDTGEASAQVRSFQIPECLHPELSITGETGSPDMSGSGQFESAFDATIPSAVPFGEEICVAVPEPERYRFNLWIVRWITIIVPDPSP